MPDRLEQMLREVAREVDFPPTPDLAVPRPAAVVRPRPPMRRILVLALLTLLVAAATVMAASPGARDAVLEFFGIDGATVEVVPELPQAPPPSPMGAPVSLAEAQERVGFEILTRSGRPPEPVYVARRVPGGVVSFATAGTTVTELRARVEREFLGKLVSEGTRVEHVRVAGDDALWLAGRPHVVFLRDASGRVIEESLQQAGNVLLVERGGVLIRVEGASSLDAARAVARSLR